MAETDRQDRIAKRAKEIWEAEGRPEGRAAEHWARAEKELAEAESTSAMPHATATEPGAAKKPRVKAAPKAAGATPRKASAKAAATGSDDGASVPKPRRKKAE